MPLNRDINSLKPKTRILGLKAIDLYTEKYKKELWVNETLRTSDVQSAYYAQGRLTKEEINALRSKVGLYLLDSDEAKKRVTNNKGTDPFPHKFGIALDVCPVNGKGVCWWTAPLKEWQNIADIFKSVEIIDDKWKYKLEWGGDWKGKDNPHFQIYRVSLLTGEKQGWKEILGLA